MELRMGLNSNGLTGGCQLVVQTSCNYHTSNITLANGYKHTIVTARDSGQGNGLTL